MHDQIGSSGSTPTGIATPKPDPADKRLPSIMHTYFQVGSFSGDKASLPRLWSFLSKPSDPTSNAHTPGLHASASPEPLVVIEREEVETMGLPVHCNLPTPPHSLLQKEDEVDLGPDKGAGSILASLKNYLSPSAIAAVDPPSRRQTCLPVSSISDDPVLASHFSNPCLPPASDALPLTEAPLLDREKPHVSKSSENLAKLTGNAPDARLKNTPPLTPRAMSVEGQSAKQKAVTSVPPLTQLHPVDVGGSTDEIVMKLDEAFPSQPTTSPQNDPPVGLGPLKGKLFVKISEARGIRPAFDPYVVCVFEWNEYISRGARDGEEEKKRRQIESDAETGRPMAIPMRSRQSSHNSALEGHDHKGKMPVTDPHWNHEAVLYVSP